ncbi:hypothetical protein NM688_g4469 [Phlebia brevispora]|uniref:Uncharacterized protein n=1 Tax=Phlebia brevispora TaxID=194682 RepID=A0ACC1T2U7_9APHY|nr:hypothetical protein NM688_g4469 [Phlebia brevispora]
MAAAAFTPSTPTELLHQLHASFRQSHFGTCDALCLRTEDQYHIQPISAYSFLQDTLSLQYEVALKTRIPVVRDVLMFQSTHATCITLSTGSSVRLVSSTSLLHLAIDNTAAIIIEDESLVIWSTEMRSMANNFAAVDRGLRQYVDRCVAEKSELDFTYPTRNSNDASGSSRRVEPFLQDDELLSFGYLAYSSAAGLRSLQELPQLQHLRGTTPPSSEIAHSLSGGHSLTAAEQMPLAASAYPVRLLLHQ